MKTRVVVTCVWTIGMIFVLIILIAFLASPAQASPLAAPTPTAPPPPILQTDTPEPPPPVPTATDKPDDPPTKTPTPYSPPPNRATNTPVPTGTGTVVLLPTNTPTVTPTPTAIPPMMRVVVYMDINRNGLMDADEGVQGLLVYLGIENTSVGSGWTNNGIALIPLPSGTAKNTVVQVSIPYLHWSELSKAPASEEQTTITLKLDMPTYPAYLP